jgi:hypothetical protein
MGTKISSKGKLIVGETKYEKMQEKRSDNKRIYHTTAESY